MMPTLTQVAAKASTIPGQDGGATADRSFAGSKPAS